MLPPRAEEVIKASPFTQQDESNIMLDSACNMNRENISPSTNTQQLSTPPESPQASINLTPFISQDESRLRQDSSCNMNRERVSVVHFKNKICKSNKQDVNVTMPSSHELVHTSHLARLKSKAAKYDMLIKEVGHKNTRDQSLRTQYWDLQHS